MVCSNAPDAASQARSVKSRGSPQPPRHRRATTRLAPRRRARTTGRSGARAPGDAAASAAAGVLSTLRSLQTFFAPPDDFFSAFRTFRHFSPKPALPDLGPAVARRGEQKGARARKRADVTSDVEVPAPWPARRRGRAATRLRAPGALDRSAASFTDHTCVLQAVVPHANSVPEASQAVHMTAPSGASGCGERRRRQRRRRLRASCRARGGGGGGAAAACCSAMAGDGGHRRDRAGGAAAAGASGAVLRRASAGPPAPDSTPWAARSPSPSTRPRSAACGPRTPRARPWARWDRNAPR